ncbi:hypothetical protein M0R45_016368 [Rubus argutus]|uniref:hAT-like transposase RNase-H fold domain-containing protein n=1 Tax=Rubus argutus TaxID=59490 RepID=A0AAW1XT66_RUBAR
MDNNWTLHKRIINFCTITSHKGDEIGRVVDQCLRSWEITKVFTITVDNASANDVAVTYMKRRLNTCKTLMFGGEFLHLRWNSTYLMLEAALKYEQVFGRMADGEMQFRAYFEESGRIGPPSEENWRDAEAFTVFLKRFYDATVKLSAWKSVTVNLIFAEMIGLQTEIDKHMQSADPVLKRVATSMKAKFDKYWGSFESVNKIIMIANVFDPRYKLQWATKALIQVNASTEVIQSISAKLKGILMRIALTPFRQEPQVLPNHIEYIIISSDENTTDESTDESALSFSSLDIAKLQCVNDQNFPLLHNQDISIVNDKQETRVHETLNASNTAMNVSDQDDEHFEPAESDYALPNQEELEKFAFDDPCFRSPRKRGREDLNIEASTSNPIPET